MIFNRQKTKKMPYGKHVNVSIIDNKKTRSSYTLILNKKIIEELATENSSVLAIFLQTVHRESRERFLSLFPEREADILSYEKQYQRDKKNLFVQHCLQLINNYCLQNCLNKQEKL